MLELLTTFNVYCYLQKFTAWKLSIIKLSDLEKKKHASPVINEFFYLSGSVSGFRILVSFPESGFRLFHTPLLKGRRRATTDTISKNLKPNQYTYAKNKNRLSVNCAVAKIYLTRIGMMNGYYRKKTFLKADSFFPSVSL